MSSSEAAARSQQSGQVNRKPKILLAATGSVAATRFGNLCHFLSEDAEVKAVATKSALPFIDRASFPQGIDLYTDEDESALWRRVGDTMLRIQLVRWADILVIAPLSANTLGKITGGLCDNLVTCIVRAWDSKKKPLVVAPSMNKLMWETLLTEKQLYNLEEEFKVSLVRPDTNSVSTRASMAADGDIRDTALSLWHSKILSM